MPCWIMTLEILYFAVTTFSRSVFSVCNFNINNFLSDVFIAKKKHLGPWWIVQQCQICCSHFIGLMDLVAKRLITCWIHRLCKKFFILFCSPDGNYLIYSSWSNYSKSTLVVVVSSDSTSMSSYCHHN